MRILHTSDWHLGKRLFKLDRSAEHEAFLEWLLTTLKTELIDVLLIAGDIFDVPNPPHSALDLFYQFLYRVSAQTKASVYIIAGNHDSGALLEAPRQLLELHRVKVWGKLSPDPRHHWIDLGPVELCAIPFFRSHELLPQGGDAIPALKKYLAKDKTKPQILMLHHLAGMFEAAGSEHVIGLSGVDSIPAELLNEFDYVALGHIHKPQKIGPRSYYSGSPIPLRFSETIAKSVMILEDLVPRKLEIAVSRKLISLKLTEENWIKEIQQLEAASELTPVAEVQITLAGPRAGLIDEIKDALAGKGIELLSFLPIFSGMEKVEKKSSKLFTMGTVDLFREYYSTRFPDDKDVPPEVMDDFVALLEKVKNAPPQA